MFFSRTIQAFFVVELNCGAEAVLENSLVCV